MHTKHLIIIALAGIGILLGLNIVNGSRHENKRAAMVNSGTQAQSATMTMATTVFNTNSSHKVNIVDNPLVEQPKAIINKATLQIDQAQQLDKERLKRVNNMQ